MVLKPYQQELLDDYAKFLSRTRELGDPAAAFRETTRDTFSYEIPYLPISETAPESQIPYVCLRVPTGGGKTMIAGHSIQTVNEKYLFANHSLTLWLVPSEAIRDQTLYMLRTPGEVLHNSLRDLFGAVNVLNIREALAVQPATLNTANTIIVSTMQSFKRDTPEGLKVYESNGQLLAHFTQRRGEKLEPRSLVDVIASRRPYVIVDEAHKEGSPLAVETLLRLQPSCILELTATPDRHSNPSNVLKSIAASVLQDAEMIKLPLELTVGPQWQPTLTEAIRRVRALEQEAVEEMKLTGEVIDPVVLLIQGESARQGHETMTPPKIKEILIKDFQIPESAIAIEYDDLHELEGTRLGQPGFPQFVITVNKLREGWDCPFAYVLFSFRNSTSATAVEQILGRVLRMPHVVRKKRAPLNHSYAYVDSDDFAATVKRLKDGLVQSGFERLEAKDLIYTTDITAGNLPLFDNAPEEDLVVPLPDIDNVLVIPRKERLDALPPALRKRVEVSPEFGVLTISGRVNEPQRRQIVDIFQGTDVRRKFRESFDKAAIAAMNPPERVKSPAENGRVERVPLLAVQQGSLLEVFDETVLLEGDWEITSFDTAIEENEFPKRVGSLRHATLRVSESDRVVIDPFTELDEQLAMFEDEGGWDQINLVGWLDYNIPFQYAERGQKVAWINGIVNHLLQGREFSLDELAYRKFRLRAAIERKLAAGLTKAKQSVLEGLFAEEDRFHVRDEHSIEFREGKYAYDSRYVPGIRLHKHFFPVIGNLRSSGEEFECAEFIANRLENVEWWVRNVERKPGSFWLQTSSDRFYPDFIVRLTNDVTLAVEYKGAHIAASRDSQEKKQIGELWARRSNGRCRFVWVEDKDWHSLRKAVE